MAEQPKDKDGQPNDFADRRRIDVQQMRMQRAAAQPGMPRTLDELLPAGAYGKAQRARKRPFTMPYYDAYRNAADYGPYRADAAQPSMDQLLDAIRAHESGQLRGAGRPLKHDFMPNRDLGIAGGPLLGDLKEGRPNDGRPSNYRSWGPYQQQLAMVEDANRFLRRKGADAFTSIDRADPYKARTMASAYMQGWQRRKAPDEVYSNGVLVARRKPSPEVFARIYNGGPNGNRKDATLPYWGAVKQYLPGKQFYPA